MLSLQHYLDVNWPFVTTSPPSPLDDDETKKIEWFCIDGGADHIVREMVSKLKKKPELKRQVIKIEEGDEDMLVTVRDGDGSLSTQKYKQVISTADRKSTRLNSSHSGESRMPSSA